MFHCLQVTKTLNERISGYCQVTLETMAYAGTGDVLKVQKMLSIVGEHVDLEEGEEWKVCLLFHFYPLQPLAFSFLRQLEMSEIHIRNLQTYSGGSSNLCRTGVSTLV